MYRPWSWSVRCSAGGFIHTTLDATACHDTACREDKLNGAWCRERSDGLHRPITYLVSKLIGEIGVMIPTSLAFSALVFYTVRLAGSFAFFWLDYLLTCSIGIGESSQQSSPAIHQSQSELHQVSSLRSATVWGDSKCAAFSARLQMRALMATLEPWLWCSCRICSGGLVSQHGGGECCIAPVHHRPPLLCAPPDSKIGPDALCLEVHLGSMTTMPR